jgi:putative N6-adenine-specific DNA methylase
VTHEHRYLYQRNNRYFAMAMDTVEDLAEAELRELGAKRTSTTYRGVYFSADPATLYRINYMTRLVTHVLAPLDEFGCHNPDYLYRRARRVNWQDFLGPDQTFAVFANVSGSKIDHSQYAALRVKDAVVDQMRDRCGRRPSVDRRDPHLWINLHIHNNRASLRIDTSGGSLHRRGYRLDSVEAPIRETNAAAILRITGWSGKRPLYDPMCGSGTILAEALMAYCRIPAGYLQERFGFMRLPDYDPRLWERVRRGCNAWIRPLPEGLIAGSDADPAAVDAARENLSRLPGGSGVRLTVSRFQELPGLEDTEIVTNPPYGKRIGRKDMETFMEELGDFLKQRCRGSVAWVYTGRRELLKSVGLRTSMKRPLRNGPMDGRLARYEIYAGSRKG